MVKTSAPEQLHGIYNVNGNAVFGDLAHVPIHPNFPCGECGFIRHWYNATVWGRCAKAAEMRRIDVIEANLIRLDTPGCKFWRAREDGEKPWTDLVEKGAADA